MRLQSAMVGSHRSKKLAIVWRLTEIAVVSCMQQETRQQAQTVAQKTAHRQSRQERCPGGCSRPHHAPRAACCGLQRPASTSTGIQPPVPTPGQGVCKGLGRVLVFFGVQTRTRRLSAGWHQWQRLVLAQRTCAVTVHHCSRMQRGADAEGQACNGCSYAGCCLAVSSSCWGPGGSCKQLGGSHLALADSEGMRLHVVHRHKGNALLLGQGHSLPCSHLQKPGPHPQTQTCKAMLGCLHEV